MFIFPVDPHDLFAERSRQFAGWGIGWDIIRRVQARIDDNWREGAGGWTYEWWQEAAAAERAGQDMLAAMLYGAARFPVVATPMREQALERQVACFERAARRLPIHFERRFIASPSASEFKVPVHIYAPTDQGREPLILLTGGVDTGKMEVHRLALLLARVGRFRVAAIDMPGMGETRIPLTADADGIYRDLLSALAPTGPKAVFGISFGGHWAAKLALQGGVDAAVDLGGPVLFDQDSAFASTLPYGMTGIIANALGLSALPAEGEIAKLVQPFSLRDQGLLEGQGAPMLVLNGAEDQYIPRQDSLIFAHHPQNRVWLLRGMTHCAPEGVRRFLPALIAWLRFRLHGETSGARLALWLAGHLLPPRVYAN